jgi:hypothetical protein
MRCEDLPHHAEANLDLPRCAYAGSELVAREGHWRERIEPVAE